MANEQSGIKFFVILTVLCLSARRCLAEEEGEGASLVLDAVKQFLETSARDKDSGSGLNLIGSALQGALKGDAVGKLGQLAEFLTTGSGKKSKTLNIISGLGTLLQASKGAGNDAKDSDEKADGGIDLSAMLSLMSTLGQFSQVSQDTPSRKARSSSEGNEVDDEQPAIPWESMLGMAGDFVSQMQGGGKSGGGNGLESLMSFLPVIMSAVSGDHQQHVSSKVPHHTHETFLPPFLESIHEYWDYFTSSGLGQMLWENSGLASIFANFQDKDGNFQADRLFGSLENNTYRRQLIKSIASFVSEWAQHMSDVNVYKSYIKTGQLLTNNFLLSSGYPKQALLNLDEPEKSISALIDEVFVRQFKTRINSAGYVEPAVGYMKALFAISKSKGVLNWLTADTVESRLTATLDSELVEPILRANRAYKFALKKKQCARYVLCVINDSELDTTKKTLKPAIAKITSMATTWYLSSLTNESFLDLYGASADSSCDEYDKDCSEFLEEDSRATTEFYHNEL